MHIIDIKPEKFDPWRLYGQLVADLVNSHIPPMMAVKTAHERLRERHYHVMEKAERDRVEVPRHAVTWLLAFDCALHCFDESDWEGFAEYLEEDKDS